MAEPKAPTPMAKAKAGLAAAKIKAKLANDKLRSADQILASLRKAREK